MSSEWMKVRLGDHCKKIGSGATPKGGKDSYLDSGPFSLIRSQNVYNDGFQPGGLAFISGEQAKKLDGVSVEDGDILLNITGDSVARVCLAPKKVLPARVNQHVAIIRPSKEVFDARFVRYFLASPQEQDLLLGLASAGATRNALTKGMIEDLEVSCPPLNEQIQIADTLGVLDDRIALLRETNATLEAIAQAIFKSWFVDFDPVHAKAEGRQPEGMDDATTALFPDGFEESELGLMPRGWRVGCLGDITRNVRIGTQPKELTSSTAYIGLEHMPRESIALGEWGNAEDIESTKSRFKKGQILFGKLRPYFHKVGIAPVDGVCSTDILVIEPMSSIWSVLSLCHLSSRQLIDYATRLSNGAKMPRTKWSDLASYQIVLPDEKIAALFESLTAPPLESIQSNLHQVRTLGELRDTLLPRLISGKLRLLEAETVMDEVP